VDIEIDGLTVRLHDTAGLRETTDTVEREGVRRAKEKISLADAILHVVDADNTITDPQLNEARVPMFTVRNKIDLNDQPPQIEHRSDGAYIKMSAKFNNGVELLRTALLDHFELGEENDNIVLARQRHIHALNRAVDALSFEFAPLCIESPELAAERLRLACGALAELTGHYTNEDLLGDIFSTFCIGK
jgi:tRNA modification GTPase